MSWASVALSAFGGLPKIFDFVSKWINNKSLTGSVTQGFNDIGRLVHANKHDPVALGNIAHTLINDAETLTAAVFANTHVESVQEKPDVAKGIIG